MPEVHWEVSECSSCWIRLDEIFLQRVCFSWPWDPLGFSQECKILAREDVGSRERWGQFVVPGPIRPERLMRGDPGPPGNGPNRATHPEIPRWNDGLAPRVCRGGDPAGLGFREDVGEGEGIPVAADAVLGRCRRRDRRQPCPCVEAFEVQAHDPPGVAGD
jgi:hypothetical protein